MLLSTLFLFIINCYINFLLHYQHSFYFIINVTSVLGIHNNFTFPRITGICVYQQLHFITFTSICLSVKNTLASISGIHHIGYSFYLLQYIIALTTFYTSYLYLLEHKSHTGIYCTLTEVNFFLSLREFLHCGQGTVSGVLFLMEFTPGMDTRGRCNILSNRTSLIPDLFT